MNMTRHLYAASLLILAAGCGNTMVIPTPAPEGLQQSGTFVVREDQVMRITTGATGKGTLTFQGWQYPFSFSDARITMTGTENAQIEGTVYNLNDVRDFEGTYTPHAEYNEAKQLTGLWAENDKGVTLHIRQLGEHVEVNFDAKGATVSLIKQ